MITVDSKKLAIDLPIIALWTLQEEGYVSLHPYEEKRLRVFTSRGVRAVVLRTDQLNGLEGRILHALARDKRATTVGADVYLTIRSIVPDSKNPFAAVMGLLIDEIVTAGYLTKVPRAGLAARLKGRPKWTLAGVAGRYPELAERAESLAQAWRGYRDDPTYPPLCEAVRRAIESRRESGDGVEIETGDSDSGGSDSSSFDSGSFD